MRWFGINQIGNFLNQSGVPAGQSGDIVQRLKSAFEANLAESKAYSDSLRQGNNSATNLTPADGDAFRNQFLPPEERPKGDTAKKDGLPAFAIGGQGQQGEAGVPGQDGTTNGNTTGVGNTIIINTAGGPGTFCPAIRQLLKSCGICSDPCKQQVVQERPVKECVREGRDYCQRIRELEKKVEALEKKLADTVECP